MSQAAPAFRPQRASFQPGGTHDVEMQAYYFRASPCPLLLHLGISIVCYYSIIDEFAVAGTK
jgi:hypothetical protein